MSYGFCSKFHTLSSTAKILKIVSDLTKLQRVKRWELFWGTVYSHQLYAPPCCRSSYVCYVKQNRRYSRHNNRLVLLDSEHMLQILQQLRTRNNVAYDSLTYKMASATVWHCTGQHCNPMYACTYRLFAGTWRPLLSVITTLYYAAIIFHRRVWYRALSLRYACIRSSGIILIPYATFVPNCVSIANSIAELAHG